MNAGSIFGRTIPSIFTSKLGVFNLLTFTTAGTGIVILCMLAVKDVAGVVVFAIFYGFFSGACTYRRINFSSCCVYSAPAAISLTGPMLGLLTLVCVVSHGWLTMLFVIRRVIKKCK
jgi:hypothetical protein